MPEISHEISKSVNCTHYLYTSKTNDNDNAGVYSKETLHLYKPVSWLPTHRDVIFS